MGRHAKMKRYIGGNSMQKNPTTTKMENAFK